MPKNKRFCEVCKKEIPITRVYRNYCSNRCYHKAYSEKNKDKLKKNKQEHYQKNREVYIKKAILWNKNHPKKRYQLTENYRKKYPERIRAQGRINDGIRYGKLKRKPCIVCNSKAHAHHPDYSKPLDVIWLCPRHHKLEHAK